MTAWSQLLEQLSGMPDELERALSLVPADRLGWKPESWGGAPGEAFSAREHVCHLRDIERDGYHVRFRRLLSESFPTLESLDDYGLARERGYESADVSEALAGFRRARAATVESLGGLNEAERSRAGDFPLYGRLTLAGLAHYARSHDQQHLAGLTWLAGKIASLDLAGDARRDHAGGTSAAIDPSEIREG
jgi:hypothetical protein